MKLPSHWDSWHDFGQWSYCKIKTWIWSEALIPLPNTGNSVSGHVRHVPNFVSHDSYWNFHHFDITVMIPVRHDAHGNPVTILEWKTKQFICPEPSDPLPTTGNIISDHIRNVPLFPLETYTTFRYLPWFWPGSWKPCDHRMKHPIICLTQVLSVNTKHKGALNQAMDDMCPDYVLCAYWNLSNKTGMILARHKKLFQKQENLIIHQSWCCFSVNTQHRKHCVRPWLPYAQIVFTWFLLKLKSHRTICNHFGPQAEEHKNSVKWVDRRIQNQSIHLTSDCRFTTNHNGALNQMV